MAEKTYVGSGRIGKYDIINIGIRFSDLPTPNEKGYINLCVGSRKEPDKFGNTHSVWINDWTPKDAKSEERKEEVRQAQQPTDDLPF